MNSLVYFLSTVVNPSNGSVSTPAADAAAQGVQTAEATGLMGVVMQNPILMIIIYCVVIFGAMYIFSIKPQKKREKAMNEMRSKIKPGDSVLLNNGMFGRITDESTECFIVEFGVNKGIRIPVLKQEVILVREPNLSNKEEEKPALEAAEKKSFFGRKKEQNENE